jgi:hypothetical protein
VFHAQANKWGCDRCRAFLDTMAPRPGALVPPAPALAPPANAAAAARRANGVKMMLLGLGLCLLGIIITSATYSSAKSAGGGRYVIAYGPIVVGAIRFFQGLFVVITG